QFIEHRFGKESLETILSKAGLSSIEDIDSLKAYDEARTVAIIEICVAVTGWSQHDVLVAFGEYFVTWALQSGYENILRGMAHNLNDFLNNLNVMHDFISQCSFRSEMRAPTFTCIRKGDQQLQLHYVSGRSGLS
ncbi:hypothetical protein PMAYCL1PPCAC_14455, partial [Pristionchus mayeri]